MFGPKKNIIISALIILVGVIFIVFAKIDLTFVCKFLSVVFCLAGVISIISYCIKDVTTGFYRLDLVYGIMSLFVALVFFTKQDVISVYFPIIAGFILFADGVIKLQHSIDMKRIDRKMKKVNEMWLVVMIFALMCLTAGVVAVYLNPSKERTLFLFVGFALVAAGITDVLTIIFFDKKIKTFNISREESEVSAVVEAAEVPLPVEEPLPAEETVPAEEPLSEEEPVPEEGAAEDAADPEA